MSFRFPTSLLARRRGAGLAAVLGGGALLATGAAALLLGAPGQAQTSGAAYECRWTDRPIRIDGRAEEAAWRGAVPLDRFGQPWQGDTPAKAPTRARLLWDRENLYFFAELEDADLFADITEHDGRTWDNDVFELFFKPEEARPGYYEFQVNAAGTVLDMFLPRRGAGSFEQLRKEGDFHLETAVVRRGTLNQRGDRDRGWTVEGRIPWTDLMRTGGRPAIGEQWKFALCRYDYTLGREPELSTSAPLRSRPSFHQTEEYAPIRFAGPAGATASRFGIAARVPLTTSRVIGSPDPPLPYRARRVYPELKLSSPVTVVHEPGSDRLLAITLTGPGGGSQVVRFRAGHPEIETLLTVDRTAYDLAFHPGFARNGYFYVGAKGPLAEENPKRQMRIARYTLSRRPPYGLVPSSEHVVIEWPSDGHDGGAMVFGHDGMMYITTGDGTSDSDTHIVGQDMTRLTAKLLRIDVEHPDPGRSYSVPKDNPFVGRPDIRPETWAYGFRNPWRMTIDRETGHIWVAQNGQDMWESAYLIQKGANYGWSVYEGSHEFYPNRKMGPTPLVKPTVEHPHSEARSLTGGLVYYGKKYPELRGAYIYGDYSTGKIWGIRHDGRRALWHKELADTTLQITGFGTDPEGEILITDHRGNGEGGLYTLEVTPPVTTPSVFPRRLSESGLFRSVRGHQVQPALVPYDVNAPLWSDGAYKERYIALPGTDSQIEMTPNRGWNFPDGAVLVKSFALEAEEGRPSTRRWVETRFMVKQEGEWVGYSYAWNEEQTDAVLVEAAGQDRDFLVRVRRSQESPEGTRKQTWHYPSRAECMACHSRAANFVLGLTTLQMNREHRFERGRDNQLRVLEHLGMLKVDWVQAARDAVRTEARARGLNDAEADRYVRQQTASSGQRQPAATGMLAVAPERLPRLVDPYDAKADLNARARSYLHSNCSQCHVSAGGGNAAIELEFVTPADGMRLFDVKPLHHTFELPDARLVAPGRPDRSVLLHRVSMRDKGYMPPLATTRVDREAVTLLRDWIRSLPPAAPAR